MGQSLAGRVGKEADKGCQALAEHLITGNCDLADAIDKELFSATDGELDAFRAMEYDPLTKELALKLRST